MHTPFFSSKVSCGCRVMPPLLCPGSNAPGACGVCVLARARPRDQRLKKQCPASGPFVLFLNFFTPPHVTRLPSVRATEVSQQQERQQACLSGFAEEGDVWKVCVSVCMSALAHRDSWGRKAEVLYRSGMTPVKASNKSEFRSMFTFPVFFF